LDGAVAQLAQAGFDVHGVAANVAEEDGIRNVVTAHRERYGRLDVLVNNAGVGIAAQFPEVTTKQIDMQLDVNLRSVILFYRECASLLEQAGAEHRNALVVNISSIAGKHGVAGMGIYSASKFGVVGFSEAMNREMSGRGVKSVALCPGFVDTAMTDWIKGSIKAEEMIQTQDIAEAVRFLLKLSPSCVVPEMMFIRPGDDLP
jgi:NAD(P)-dependent dehydrogenase (short-subunit alcohol dehydrogenase family)